MSDPSGVCQHVLAPCCGTTMSAWRSSSQPSCLSCSGGKSKSQASRGSKDYGKAKSAGKSKLQASFGRKDDGKSKSQASRGSKGDGKARAAGKSKSLASGGGS